MNSDISIPRNKTIAKLFRLVKLAENAGFGFDRMNTGWSSCSKVLPEYTTERDFVIVKFFLEPETVEKGSEKTVVETVGKTVVETVGETVGEKLSESAKHIIQAIKENQSITREELAAKTGLSVRGVE